MNRRKKATVSSRKWSRYATAATAAAAVAITSGAHADVTVIEPDLQLRDPDPKDFFAYGYAIYLDEFRDSGAFTRLWFGHVYNVPYGGTQVEGFLGITMRMDQSFSSASLAVVGQSHFSSNSGYASKLAYGQNISSQNFISIVGSDSFGSARMANGSGQPRSQFLTGPNGYLGFRFNVGEGTQYGWAEFTQNEGPNLNVWTLDRIAFADAGESLTAGQVPEPGALGVLAMGATALIAWRRRRVGNQAI